MLRARACIIGFEANWIVHIVTNNWGTWNISIFNSWKTNLSHMTSVDVRVDALYLALMDDLEIIFFKGF